MRYSASEERGAGNYSQRVVQLYSGGPVHFRWGGRAASSVTLYVFEHLISNNIELSVSSFYNPQFVFVVFFFFGRLSSARTVTFVVRCVLGKTSLFNVFQCDFSFFYLVLFSSFFCCRK